MLGTGNATVTECYNTCFVITDKNKHFMVDGGGGNTVLHQLKAAGFNWMDVSARGKITNMDAEKMELLRHYHLWLH